MIAIRAKGKYRIAITAVGDPCGFREWLADLIMPSKPVGIPVVPVETTALGALDAVLITS